MRSFLFMCVTVLTVCAQTAAPPKRANDDARPYAHTPDVANVAYGPHERNVLDLWKAQSAGPAPLVVHIHGGGFTHGDKSSISNGLLELCLKKGISVATINYRYSNQAPFPAPYMDCVRAIQFLRARSKEWNLNPKLVAATGGSAGAGMSLWIGFHPDMADLTSDDPVKRQSTRLTVVGVTNAQVSYDPHFIAKLIDGKTSDHVALTTLVGVKPEERESEKARKLFEESAPINYLDAGSPPVFMYYNIPMKPFPPTNLNEGIHNPRFGLYLKDKMDKLGIECVVRQVEEYPERSMASAQMTVQMVDFFEKYFARQ
jgi:acetyl esterase